jgi:hypothetical protein
MKTIHFMYVIALVPVLAIAADSPFFTFNVSLSRDGTQVSMTFEETQRTDTGSVVEVSGITPGTNTTTLYLIGAMCALAKARGQSYFQAKEVQTEPPTLEVTFPKTGPDTSPVPLSAMAPNVYPVSQCPILTFQPTRRVRPVQPRTQ